LNKTKEHLTVFEHEAIRFDKGEKRITKDQFYALQKYFGEGVPFYSLSYNGVKFNEFVGVIQVGTTLVEVLPKVDKADTTESNWRNILIGMLRAVGAFDIKTSSESNLKIKPNTILDLYFEMFVKEVEYLLHNGLIKQYRMKEDNVNSLKGSLQFSKHLQQNLTHHERFYIRHSVYDVEHKLHLILYKTIRLLKQINTNIGLKSRIGALMLLYPEMPDLNVTEATFDNIAFTRKNQSYKKAIDISKLLLLQFHPDISRGRNNVLALMFDMNKLWERFVYVSLCKNKSSSTTITAQYSKFFWKPEKGNRSKMRPDIVINKDKSNCVVLDTKWKNLACHNPSSNDLRQLYVYHEYYGAMQVALIYPGTVSSKSSGTYLDPKTSNPIDKECSVISLSVEPNVKQWQKNISEDFKKWLKN
jgi:5-methylcytosine-specific restriction enzyme subunit McrC